MPITFLCDFCLVHQVDLIHGKGKQEVTYPSKHVKSKSTEDMTPRLLFRCDNCIQIEITTTQDDWSIHNAGKITKLEATNEGTVSGGANKGLHVAGKDGMERAG